MTWLFPAVVSTLVASLLLSAAYGYLYSVYRERYLAFWFASWSVYSLRYIFLLLLLKLGKTPLLYFASLSMILFALYLLYRGTAEFIGKQITLGWKLAFGAIFAWTALAVFAGFPFLLLTVPLFGFFACVDIWVGYNLLRSRFAAGAGQIIVGTTFIVWGLHQADYPILRPVAWFAPFGFMIGTSCAVIIALGMLIMFFERMRFELAAKESQLRQLFEEAPYGIALAEPGGTISDCNAVFAEMLQREKAELIGQHQREIHPPEEWTDMVSRTFREHLREKENQILESRLVTASGQLIDVEIKARLVALDGKQYLQGFFKDITEHKRIEAAAARQRAEFKAIFNAISDAVVFADPQRRILMVNPAFSEIFGYQLEEVAGKSGLLLYADPKQYVLQGQERFNRDAVIVQTTFEADYRRKNGDCFPGETLGSHVVNEDGELIGFLGVIRDISERRQAEQKRAALEAELQQAYKMEAIGTMAGGIAHDFNNLLTIITGNLELVQRKSRSGGDFSKNINHMKNAVRRATDLVKQILTFSRREGQLLAPLDLSAAVQHTMDLLRSTIPSTVEIMCTVEKGPVFANADRTQLQQVLINLCTNAVHAMAEKGLLKISLAKVRPGEEQPTFAGRPAGEYVKLSVSDTGHGMDSETMSKVFDPFFTTKGIGKGTGMGLSVVHGIVEQHGGFITVDSAPGQGAVFNVYFPVSEAVGADPEYAAEEQLPGGSESILLVDDEESIVSARSELLGDLGYQVTVTTSSSQALDLFRTFPGRYDLVLTDQTMPDLSGIDLSSELLKIKPGIPIILNSGYSSQVSEAEAKSRGIREFCLKPMGNTQLANVIRKVLDETNQLSPDC